VDDAEFEYVTGQGRPSFPALLARYEQASAEQARREDALLDLRYGPAARQLLDFFPAGAEARGTIAYFHAGYWQSRDKSTFRFVAKSFNRGGLNVAVVNYPLCPDVTIAELIDAVAAAVPVIGKLSLGRPIVLAGHSAGGHIAVELGMRETDRASHIAGIVAISGVFDLQPLVKTSLNGRLNLDDSLAGDASPVFRVKPGSPPAIFTVGGSETGAFLQQTRNMFQAWRAAGNDSRHHIVVDADHFSVLQSLTDPKDVLHRMVSALV
jgi:arylformamidase